MAGGWGLCALAVVALLAPFGALAVSMHSRHTTVFDEVEKALQGTKNAIQADVHAIGHAVKKREPCLHPPFVPRQDPGGNIDLAIAKVVRASWFAEAAYCTPPELLPWTCKSCVQGSPLVKIQVIDDEAITLQAFVGQDPNATEIVVAFRGSLTLQDFAADGGLVKTRLSQQGYFSELHSEKCEVQAAIYENYLKAFRKMHDLPALVVGMMRAAPRARVLVTGHSLGGVLAQLFALDLSIRPEAAHRQIEIVTFGGLRVGNANFARVMKQRFPGDKFYRVVNYRDPAAHIPTHLIGYVHGGHEFWIKGFTFGGALVPDMIRMGNDLSGGEDPNGEFSTNGGCDWAQHVSYLNGTHGNTCDLTLRPNIIQGTLNGLKAAFQQQMAKMQR